MELIGKSKLLEGLKELKQNLSASPIVVIKDVESLIENLEVKEADFGTELDEWMKTGPHTSYPWCTIPDAIKITAEHFFELGMSASNKTQKEE